MDKPTVYALIGIIIATAFLTIGQVWGPVMGWGMYFKVIITLGVLFAVVGLITIVKSDMGRRKKLKDGNYLD